MVSQEELILVAYLALCVALFALVAPDLAQRPNGKATVFLLLAAVSLGSTWTFMLRYFQHSFKQAAIRAGVPAVTYTAKEWLASTSLFVEAWGQVCSTPLAWWWSEQLCSWTAAPFTIFLYLESERYNIRRPWAYMLLGQVVAISFAQSLFLAAIALAPPPNPSVRASRDPNIDSTLNNATLGSLATVFFAFRSYSSPYFLANLLVMHILILIPLVPNPLPQVRKAATYSTLYTTTLFATLAIRFLTYRTVLASSPSTFPNIISLFHQLPGLAYTTFFSHPAQTSISFDVLFTTLSFIAFMLLTDTSLATRSGKTSVSPKVIAGAIALTPWLGIASTGAAYLAARELGIESYEAELKGVKKVE